MKQSTPTKDIYLQKVNKVVEYINNHLDSPLDIKTLAGISSFSTFHFHRIMKAYLKEPLYEYISRIRLETAARLLRYSQLPIQEIGDNIGYDTPSSLSKAFKLKFGISPVEYRNNKEYIIQRKSHIDEGFELKSPKIKELKDRRVIYIRLLGAYSDCDYGAAYEKLWNHIKINKLFSVGMEVLSICYDDPMVTQDNKCRTDACVVIRKETTPDGDIGVKELEGGLFAIFTHKGPYEQLSVVYDNIFAKWLPGSEYALCDQPIMAKYLNNPTKTTSKKLKTEIYVSITKL